MKTCSKCGVQKPLDKFTTNGASRDGHRPDCKSCRKKNRNLVAANKHARAWQLANPEKYREVNKRTKEKRREHYAMLNKRYAERNREKRCESVRQWSKRNPQAVIVNNRNRHARKVGAEGRHTKAQIETLYENQKAKCVYCAHKLNGKFHADHITPLVRGGSNDITNIQLLCQHCNNHKHVKDGIEFAQQLGMLL